MIRVLVAEDSPTACALLVRILSDDPEIEVVGEAKDGVEAVAMTQTLLPDLITMDIQMPHLDGLAATKEIMITAPRPIVIVTGGARFRDVETSLAALRVGALDVLEKPPSPDLPGFKAAADKLVAVVKAMSQVKVVRHWRPPPSSEVSPKSPGVATGSSGRIVAIAASTGGPAALQQLFSELPGDFAVPIVVVQHITSGFTSGLATWLNNSCALQVKVAEAGEPLGHHTVYIAPDNRHLGVAKNIVVLSDAPPIAGFRPSGTYLFESVARGYGASAIAVVLTGMGDDGVQGLRAIRQAGGKVIAQDQSTSVIFGMPEATIKAGLANAVLPLDAIAARLVTLV